MQANALWSMGFMAYTLYGVRRFRTFNMLDEGAREALAIEVDTSLPDRAGGPRLSSFETAGPAPSHPLRQ